MKLWRREEVGKEEENRKGEEAREEMKEKADEDYEGGSE